MATLPPGAQGTYKRLYDSTLRLDPRTRGYYNRRLEVPITQRLSKGVRPGLSFRVIGDEKLILNIAKADAYAARMIKKQRRSLAERLVIPELKRQIPNTHGRFVLRQLLRTSKTHNIREHRKKLRRGRRWHLQTTPKVASSTLEGTLITVGSPFNWYPGILHNRTRSPGNVPNPFVNRALTVVEEDYRQGHEKIMSRVLLMLADRKGMRLRGR